MREPTYEEQIPILVAFVGNERIDNETKDALFHGFAERFGKTEKEVLIDMMACLYGESKGEWYGRLYRRTT